MVTNYYLLLAVLSNSYGSERYCQILVRNIRAWSSKDLFAPIFRAQCASNFGSDYLLFAVRRVQIVSGLGAASFLCLGGGRRYRPRCHWIPAHPLLWGNAGGPHLLWPRVARHGDFSYLGSFVLDLLHTQRAAGGGRNIHALRPLPEVVR
eukprot:6465421-Amphidinium_carterae.1